MEFFTAMDYSPEAQLKRRLRTALETYKIVHLRRVPEPVDLDSLYQGLARSLGDFLFKNEDPVTAALDSEGWIDMRYDPALAAEHAYRHGNGRMPLHMDGVYTDVVFDIIFLFCTASPKYGGATTFIDGPKVIDFLQAYDPVLLNDLRSTYVRFSKGTKSKYWPIIFEENGMPAFNWNLPRLSADNTPEAKDMCLRFNEFCETRLVDGGLMTNCKLEKGDAVFFHNRLLLHGRNSFWGERCLMKGAIRWQAAGELSGRAREQTLELTSVAK
jgi:alpha-ketoglutarate-dependent taurine dioxygenase